MFDKCGDQDAQKDLAALNALASIIGLNTIDPQFTTGPAQFLEVIEDTIRSIQTHVLSGGLAGVKEVVDGNRTVSPGNGNGGGDSVTVYRLQEGVERLMIEDVTNAGASAMSQSEIFVMWDNVAKSVGTFNHVPGGCNVLYLDGHVEFVKYPGPPPVSRVLAEITGVFDKRPDIF